MIDIDEEADNTINNIEIDWPPERCSLEVYRDFLRSLKQSIDQIVHDLSNAERNALAWVCNCEAGKPPTGMVLQLTKLYDKKLVLPPKFTGYGWQPTKLGLEIREKISRG